IEEGCIIDYFLIRGKGIKGYLSQVSTLKKYLRENDFDIIHAHYSFSGIFASLAGANPLIVSLMGSDLYFSALNRYLVYPFALFSWNRIILKSKQMNKLPFKNKIRVIPNGVNTKLFKPSDKT